MAKSQDVPDWVTTLIVRIREYQQQAELYDSRELHTEAEDAKAGARANIRHLARRLNEPGL